MFKVELINGDEITVVHGLGISVQSGSIKKETNSADSFELSMLPDNPGYNIIHPLITRVRVTRTDNKQLMFDGRILQPKDNMESSGALTRTFTCEGSLAYFHDIVPGYGSITGTWHDVINWLLNIFNEQSESWKHVELGDVPNTGNVTVNIDTENDLYDTMYKFIVTNNGYEWRIRNENNHRYLDVNNKLGDTKKEPVIRLAFNLQSMSVESDPTSVVSRVIPLGKAVDGANTIEGVTTPRIHLGMVGKQYYVDSQDLINEYGVQAKAKIWDDVTDPNQLEQLAINYLNSQNPVTTKFSVSALDLSTIGLTTDDFEIYNYYHVNNPLMNVDDDLRVNGVTIDIINPQNASLTIGDKFKRQTDYAIEAINNGSNIYQVKQSVSQLSQKVKKTDETVNNLDTTVKDVKKKIDSVDFDELDSISEKIDQIGTIDDQRGENQSPSWFIENYPKGKVREFHKVQEVGLTLPSYVTSAFVEIETRIPWENKTGGYPIQTAYTTQSNKPIVLIRIGISDTTWSDWQTIT